MSHCKLHRQCNLFIRFVYLVLHVKNRQPSCSIRVLLYASLLALPVLLFQLRSSCPSVARLCFSYYRTFVESPGKYSCLQIESVLKKPGGNKASNWLSWNGICVGFAIRTSCFGYQWPENRVLFRTTLAFHRYTHVTRTNHPSLQLLIDVKGIADQTVTFWWFSTYCS